MEFHAYVGWNQPLHLSNWIICLTYASGRRPVQYRGINIGFKLHFNCENRVSPLIWDTAHKMPLYSDLDRKVCLSSMVSRQMKCWTLCSWTDHSVVGLVSCWPATLYSVQESVSGKNGHCWCHVGWGKVHGDPNWNLMMCRDRMCF